MVMRELAAAATENFRAHATFPSRGVAEALVRETPELTWVDSGLDTDTFNIVMGARLAAARVAGALRDVLAHFESAARPFSWWMAPGDQPPDLARYLVEGGLVKQEWELAMGRELDPGTVEAPAVPGLEIERAKTPEQLADFARINAENWTPPDPLVDWYYARAAGALLDEASPLRFYLARREGKAVAAVEIAARAETAGVYNLSTRREHRGAGIGGALLAAALEEAARAGARTAVLQAAPSASGLYRRLGFVEFGRIAEFKPARSVR